MDREKREELERTAIDELRRLNVPGAALAIVHEDEPVYVQCFGVASSETGQTLTPETLLRIGSLTKVITAYTLLDLAREQHIDVHLPLRDFVRDLPPLLGGLNIHQLLCHTAGLKDDFSHYGPHDEAALGRAVRAYGERHFFSEPGRIYSYAALGYAVAGVVIEALSGQAYAQAVQERVLAPLRMERSTFYPTRAMTYPLSQGHEVGAQQEWSVVRPYDDTAERWPSGFLFSSVVEFTRFVRAFMNAGRLDGEQVLTAEVIAQQVQAHARITEASSDGYYGYGLFLSLQQGLRQLALGGGRRGFSSHLQMIPQRRFAVIQLLNRAGGVQLRQTPARARQLLLALQGQSDTALAEELPIDAAEKQRLAGRFARPDIHATEADNLQLLGDAGGLMLRFGSRDRLMPVKKIGAGRFALQFDAHSPPFIFAFSQGVAPAEDFLCCMHRAYKRVSSRVTPD